MPPAGKALERRLLMSQREIRNLIVRLLVLGVGAAVLVLGAADGMRQVNLIGPVAAVIFFTTGLLARMGDISSPRYGRVTVDEFVPIAAALLFPLPAVLLMLVAYSVTAALIKQEKIALGGPLYILASRAIVLWGAALVLQGKPVLAASTSAPSLLSLRMAQVVAFGGAYFLLENFVDRLEDWLNDSVAVIPAIADRFASLYQVYMATVSVGILVAVMYRAMGPYALLVFGIPMAVIRYSFGLIASIKQTYEHTIRALVRAMEVEDPHSSSHSERVADLATQVASELGIVGDNLESVNYGALLHDIGRLGVDYQRVGHFMDEHEDSVAAAPHALVGAEILEQVPFLKKYGGIVAHHHDPYQGPQRGPKDDTRRYARIVAVANCYDRLTNGADRDSTYSSNQAVGYMRSEIARFDPTVLRALIAVLQRKGKLVVTGYSSWSHGAD